MIAEYLKSVKVRRDGDSVFVTPPFFHLESDESIALRFSKTADGRPVVTDCGTTKEYLQIMDIRLEEYREKLDAIKERFGIEEKDGAFVMTMPTDNWLSVRRHIGYFLQAISIIANIDI